MDSRTSSFWDDLAEDLRDPEFRTEYIRQTIRIATFDRIVAELDEAREAAGLSKAALGRAVDVEPSVVRRLFSRHQANPTLGTLSEVAAALGLEITLTPLSDEARECLTEPLRNEGVEDTRALARQLEGFRSQSLTST